MDLPHPARAGFVHELVARQAAATPEAVAVIDGDRTLSYAELDGRASQFASFLRTRGAAPEAPVGVCLERSASLVIALLAVWKAGAAYIPLDPSHPRERTRRILAETGAPLVLAEPSVAGELSGDAIDCVPVDRDLAVANGLSRSSPPVKTADGNAAYVLYTSGSTGAPKGVVVSHAGIANRIRWMIKAHGLSASDRVLQKTALSFDAACLEFFAPLASGGTVVLAPPGAERDPAAITQAAIEHQVTVLQFVPSVLRAVAEEPGWDRCASLRLLFCAGEQLHAELVQRFLALLPDGGAGVEVWNTYGPTECSVDITAYRVDLGQRSGPVPIGRPIDGMRVLVADPAGRPAAVGARGELCAGGVGVARGYLGRPGLTAACFVPDPYGPPGSRLYRTGDLARWRSDGNLEYLGRIDDQVKVNGVRIEPGEVEAALEAHPGIARAAVAAGAVPDGGTRLVAYVQGRNGSLSAGRLRAFLGERLPATHIPSVFVELDSFPTTSSGKLDRSALPPPRSDDHAGPGPDAQCQTDAERLVAGLWRELLDLGEVSATDDFFHLGGTSLQFTRLANRLRTATGRGIELPQLLSATTVRAQAQLVGPGLDAGPTAGGAPAVRPVPRDRPLPLSFGQRRLWVLDRMRPGDREWVSGLFLRLPAGTGRQIVAQALDFMLERHEALRTRFIDNDGEPAQIVIPPGPVELLTLEVTRDELAAVLDKEMQRGFDLERGVLVRGVLARDPHAGSRAEAILVLLIHHIACDGWSSAVIESEFHQVIAALRAGLRPALPALPVQYADYALWQRERLTPEVVDRELSHWRAVLDSATPLALRPDKQRPAVRDARGAVERFAVPEPVTRVLGELGRRHDATPFMTLLTAFATLLARYTAQWDVTVGTPVAGRERPEVEGVVGFFLNSLVIRCRLDGRLSLPAAIETVRDTCRTAFAHKELPFERLVDELAPPGRDLSRTPLYQVAFDLHDEKLTGSASHLADVEMLTEVSRVAKTDLTLYMRAQPDGTMIGGFEYSTALFHPSTIERMARHFLRLLDSLAAAGPGTRLDELDFTLDDDLRALSAWDHAAELAGPASVLGMFEERAASAGQALAVVAGDTEVSFAELDQRADKLARHLRRLGVGPESVVGVLLDRGADLMACLLGIWKAGAAYLPLDPAFPADRVNFMLADSGAQVAVTHSASRARFGQAFSGHLVLTDADAGQIAAEPPGRAGGAPDPDTLAYVIYTSGSTGRPKGVQVTHRGLANHVRWAASELAERGAGGAPLFSSIAFDLVMPNLWAPLVAGWPVHMLPSDADLTELGPRLAAAGGFGFIKLTPGHLQILSEQVPPEQARDLARVIVVAGEALPVRLADHWARMLGDGRLINEYGPTEASVGTCTFPVTAPVTADAIPIGRPLPGVSMYVLDEFMRRVPVGVAGELYVGGAGVARGYAGHPELTAERFLPDPYGPPAARVYRTGDLVRVLPDGNVDFIGRLDGQVKIRGHRVEVAEIQAVLAEHPAVRDAVVVLAGDGHERVRLAAYCVPATADPARESLPEELAAHCAARLPDYMVPATVQLIGALPLNANGKLDRVALARLSDAPADEDIVKPEGFVEERIAEIFTSLLGRPVGADTHFFHVGGNSILAVRLVAAIQSSFEVTLPIRAVFEGPTVAELARRVQEVIRAEIEQMPEAELIAQTQRYRTAEQSGCEQA